MKVLVILAAVAALIASVAAQGFGGPQFPPQGFGPQFPPQGFGGPGFGGQGIQGFLGGAGGVSYVAPTLWGNQGPRFL